LYQNQTTGKGRKQTKGFGWMADRKIQRKSKSNKTVSLSFEDKGFTARILNPHDSNDRKLFEEFRYTYWVEEFKFLSNRINPDKRERDRYDDHAVHFGVFDERHNLVGYARFILPGEHGLQVQIEFKNLLKPHHEFPSNLKRSVESSRLIVPRGLSTNRRYVSQLIYKLKYQYMKKCGFRYWYHISEMKLIRALKRQMYPFKIVGECKDYQNGVCYPAVMDLEEVDPILIKKAPEYYRWLNEGLDDTLYYDTFISRNSAFLDIEQVDIIKKTRILFAGCGLGSNIAVLAARMGFTRFIVADYDKIELSNLNRQTFMTEQIGMNKAVALADLLVGLQPEAEVEIVPEVLTPSTAQRLIRDSDVIVNTVDFDATCYAINDMAVMADKPVFFPLNVGFGGFLLVFDKTTPSLADMTGGVSGNNAFLSRLAGSIKDCEIPKYLNGFMSSLDMFESLGYLPQTGIAVNISSSLVVLAIMGYLSGWPIKRAPYPITADAMFAINADHSHEIDVNGIKKHMKITGRTESSVVKRKKLPPLILG
jgi:molybdopterin/thiamine biosynthesis adenylyltransferase/N-acyl-L-homoserine lactone synthetase